MLFPHWNDIIIAVNTINISWKLDFFFLQKSRLSFWHSFSAMLSAIMVSLSLLHFLSAYLNLLRDNFIIVKTSPCLGLPISLHVKYACRAASCNSFTCSFQPGTSTSLLICLPDDTNAWLHFFKELTIESYNSSISSWWLWLRQLGSLHLMPCVTFILLSSRSVLSL